MVDRKGDMADMAGLESRFQGSFEVEKEDVETCNLYLKFKN
jgi:hypothetical protein